MSALMLVVSGLSLSALTAAIDVAPTAAGPPVHAFTEEGRGPIPRAAFEGVRAIPARGPAAFGGDRVYDVDIDGTSYRVHEFTTPGTSSLVVTRPLAVEYLVVGGGGAGGASAGGGGGAGGFVAGELELGVGPTTVTVGAGGTSSFDNGSTLDGAPSALGGVVALGGGGGMSMQNTFPGPGGRPGGSGGGGTRSTNSGSASTSGAPGGAGQQAASASGGSGSSGAAGIGVGGNDTQGGGGGGAGGAGSVATTSNATAAGNGGPGSSSSITGVPIQYAGGGGGGVGSVYSRAGAGGSGGGGAGAVTVSGTVATGSPGAPGTGGGGGGGSARDGSGALGGAGGSGIVIVRYPIPRSVWAPAATGGTVTELIGDGTDGTVAGFRYRVHTFATDGELVIPDGSTIPTVDALLVGGGGGGGSRHGGGGGGGGVLEVLGHPLDVTGTFPVLVGQGGAGTTASSAGQSGGDSGALGLTATGGGRGAGLGHAALPGGSGGGGNAAGVSGAGRVEGQGNAGGAGVGTSGNPEGGYGGGGGGGAGQIGSAATSGGATENASAGRGGDGRVSTLSGAPVVYGGGGGGSISHRSSGVTGVGGLGGGGNGGSLGWELYDASSVGRSLSWRLFLHNLAHPSTAAGFEQFFAGAVHSSGSAPLVVADQNATGTNLGTTNVLNWVNAGQLADFIGTLPRTDNFALEVSGWFVPRETGVYHFTVESDDAADLRIGATTVAAFYGGRGTPALGTTTGSISLVAGQGYAFRARMEEGTGGEGLRVFWQTPSQRAVSTTVWWQNADELLGNRPSGSPLDAAELVRFATLSSRFATPRGLGTVSTQSLGTTTPNTLNWAHPSSGASNELPLASVIGVSGLADDFMLTVAGTFVPKETGTYTFALSGDDAVDLAVDGTVIVAHYGQKGAPPVGDRQGTVTLEAGVPVQLTVRHHQRDGGAVLRVFWRKPSQTSGWHQDAEELRSTGRDGVDGLGGGGGAGGFTAAANAAGGRGGDGVVVIRYPLARVIDAIPSEVRDLVAGEGRSTAVLRWRQPAIDPPSPDTDGYRIEYAPLGGGSWTEVTGATFGVDPEDAARVIATVSGLPEGSAHRFRITPVGTVDGPSRTVEPVAKGGDVVTLVGDDVVHRFTTAGSAAFELSTERTVEHLVVGGGGAGGSAASGTSSGGGGGGQVVTGSGARSAGSYAVVVGAGGVATPVGAIIPSGGAAPDGGSSSLGVTGGSAFAEALGGGGGASARIGEGNQGPASATGWTGGGGAVHASNTAPGSTGVGGAGRRGGDAFGDGLVVDPQAAGGGGGSGGAGADATSGAGGDGGAGTTSDITGSAVAYGGGGGGGKRNLSGSAGTGRDGGGDGGREAAGSDGVRGGGGGGAGTANRGGDGGAGVVVLRYALAPSESSAPSNVSGTPGDGSVSLTWDAPTFSGGSPVLGYEVGRSTDGGTTWSDWEATGSTEAAATVSGLTNGTAYVFRVRALNAVGPSDPSAPSPAITPRTVPGAPVIGSVTGGDGTLDVVFSVPSDGGATVTSIEYRLDDGPWTPRSPASAASPLTLDGLENERTYTVRLRAINVAGSSEESAPVTGTPMPVLYAFDDFVFTNGTQTGRFGPTLANLLAAYDTGANPWLQQSEFYSVSGGIQLWTVPATGAYRITAYGAQGADFNAGASGPAGGRGARMSGVFTLEKGDQLRILVGQRGGERTGTGTNAGTGAGGGGTFVARLDDTPLIVAGGGGAAGINNSTNSDASTGTSGRAGTDGSAGQGGINGGGGGAASGGTAGNGSTPGGQGTSCSWGSGGGGFLSRGGHNCDGSAPQIGGQSFVDGGAGGAADTGRGGVAGGFGGGAGVGHRAPGGGGYSGGGGDQGLGGGGGGGSFNAGTAQDNAAGANTGHGRVEITFLG